MQESHTSQEPDDGSGTGLSSRTSDICAREITYTDVCVQAEDGKIEVACQKVAKLHELLASARHANEEDNIESESPSHPDDCWETMEDMIDAAIAHTSQQCESNTIRRLRCEKESAAARLRGENRQLLQRIRYKHQIVQAQIYTMEHLG